MLGITRDYRKLFRACRYASFVKSTNAASAAPIQGLGKDMGDAHRVDYSQDLVLCRPRATITPQRTRNTVSTVVRTDSIPVWAKPNMQYTRHKGQTKAALTTGIYGFVALRPSLPFDPFKHCLHRFHGHPGSRTFVHELLEQTRRVVLTRSFLPATGVVAFVFRPFSAIVPVL